MTKVVNISKSNNLNNDCDVYIGRPTQWGNPFIMGKHGTREEVVEKYRDYIKTKPNLLNQLHKLKNKRLGCFCKPKECHGDVLVELIEK